MALIPSGAGRPHGANPGGAGGGCDHWPPKRLGFRGAEEGNVNFPACRAVRKCRAFRELEGGGVVEKGVAGPGGLGHVFLGLLHRGETIHNRVDAEGVGSCFLPRCIDPGDMTQAYRIESSGWGSRS